jgi:uncharacterized membrane protein
MFSLFKKKSFLTIEENKKIVDAISKAEHQTSGEIRIYLESKNPLINTVERAAAIFLQLKMHETRQRNAVLIYLAVKDREVALYGDEGIHNEVGTAFWNKQVSEMIALFKQNSLSEGIVKCVTEVGQVLAEKFPFNEAEDKNELPDEIIFGK